jgi:hypothetical protein
MSEEIKEVEAPEIMISIKDFLEILNMTMELSCPERDYFNMTCKDIYAAGATDSAEYVRYVIATEIKKRYFPEQYAADLKVAGAAQAAAEEEAKKAKEVTLPTPPEGSLQ